MHRHWTENASRIEVERPLRSKSKVERPPYGLKVERTSAEADSKTIYLLVQNYPKLKKIIYPQIT